MTCANRFSSHLGYNIVLDLLCEKMGVDIIQSCCIGTNYIEVATNEQGRQIERKRAVDEYERTVSDIESDDPKLSQVMNDLYKAKNNHISGGNGS